MRQLRTKGLSLGQIYEKTGVPKTTIRSWIKDIKAFPKQLDELKSKTQKALQGGRIRKQKQEKSFKTLIEKELLHKGIAGMGNLTNRDFF